MVWESRGGACDGWYLQDGGEGRWEVVEMGIYICDVYVGNMVHLKCNASSCDKSKGLSEGLCKVILDRAIYFAATRDALMLSTTGFRLLEGRLQSCLLRLSASVKSHSVSAAAMRV